MNRKLLFKNMMLAGLVVVPLVGVNAQDQNQNHDPDYLGSSADVCDNVDISGYDNTWTYCVFETEDDVDTFSFEAGVGPGCFQIVDAFIAGDAYDVTKVENGNSFTTVKPFAGNPYGNEYYGGQGGLSANFHTLEASVNAVNTGIFPAGYYVRFIEGICGPLKGGEIIDFIGRVIINTSGGNIDIPGVAENVMPRAIVVVPE